MKNRNKPAIKRNVPQSAADNFTPEQIAEWKAGVARRRNKLLSMDMEDDNALIPFRGKPAADGNRYKAIGNGMAVPCVRWIFERIEEAVNGRNSWQ